MRTWQYSSPTLISMLCDFIFSFFFQNTVFSLPVLSVCRVPIPSFLVWQHRFSITGLFYPTWLWSFMIFPSYLLSREPHPLLLGTSYILWTLELGSHIQATKVLNGTHPGPRSSCAHALMLQSLPSRDFFSLKSLFAIHTIFRIATELYKPCAVRFTVPIPVYTCCFSPSGDALPRLQV